MLSLKNVNAIGHFTDWIVAHVHVGALGWNGFLTFGMLYWLIPQMWKTSLYSKKLANVHFWLGTLGILFYALPLYWAGITQSLMWKEFTQEGFLKYPNFLETVQQILPMYMTRAAGGALYLSGVLVMVYNLYKTAGQGTFVPNEAAEAPALTTEVSEHKEYWHRALEKKPIVFTVLATIAILIGGVFELIPTFLIKSNVPTITAVKPYTPLELHGRDIYIKEGCVNCHSQMVRPFRSETERYGEYSKAGEFVYDHPFLWGSKRTGPDLQRLGQKYPDSWHYHHMVDPTSMSPGSIMPPYPWLLEQTYDKSLTADMVTVMRKLGVPYEEGYENQANADVEQQADKIVKNLKDAGIEVKSDREMVALIAYLQRLGTDIKVKPNVIVTNE
jgi:cytochrome c oxidase cbb3-type subunit I/II